MDLNTVETTSIPTSRDELWPLGPGDAILAGGTWLFSEPQPHIRRLVDITRLGWPPITVTDNGIELAATCTLAEVSELSSTAGRRPPRVGGSATVAPVLHRPAGVVQDLGARRPSAATSACRFPAGAMISLTSALDGELTVWRADGSDYRLPVTEFVTGSATNALGRGRRAAVGLRCPRRRCAPRTGVPQARPVAAGPIRRRRHRPARHHRRRRAFRAVGDRRHRPPVRVHLPRRPDRRPSWRPRTAPSPTTPGPSTPTATPTGAAPSPWCSAEQIREELA